LFTFVGTHLLNHAWGLASLEALDLGRDIFVAVWRSWPGIVVLYGAVLTHLVLVLWTLFQRRSLRLAPWEGVQTLLGLALPFLLVEHVLGTRGLNIFFAVEDNYIYEILVLWLFAPEKGIFQTIVIAVAWAHGCIGLHFWLKLKSWYPVLAPCMFAFALLLPVCAVMGFVAAGREIKLLAQDPFWLEDAYMTTNFPMDDAVLFVAEWKHTFWIAMGALLALVLLARYVRWAVERRRGMARLKYPDGRTVEIRPGTSVLEASREAGIPHASVCGGRGRCSTCRIRVGLGRDHLAPPNPEEIKVLKRVGAPEHIRLACQLKPTKDLEVTPLLPANATPKDAWRRPDYLQGSEKEIAILFADIRAFTKFAENKLPYDVVFVLNRYFRSMGEAVLEAGGTLDKFIGDGVMALFGADITPEEAARRALAAARSMAAALDELNDSLRSDLPEPLRIGIGIHLGTVIVGEMGFAGATSFTAIGDAVNTASRLEQATKEFGCQLVVSDELATRAGIDLGAHRLHEIQVRGRTQPIQVRAIARARDLPEISIPSRRRRRRRAEAQAAKGEAAAS
jgi:adenylate cyclase